MENQHAEMEKTAGVTQGSEITFIAASHKTGCHDTETYACNSKHPDVRAMFIKKYIVTHRAVVGVDTYPAPLADYSYGFSLA